MNLQEKLKAALAHEERYQAARAQLDAAVTEFSGMFGGKPAGYHVTSIMPEYTEGFDPSAEIEAEIEANRDMVESNRLAEAESAGNGRKR